MNPDIVKVSTIAVRMNDAEASLGGSRAMKSRNPTAVSLFFDNQPNLSMVHLCHDADSLEASVSTPTG